MLCGINLWLSYVASALSRKHQEPILPTQININPSIARITSISRADEINYPFPNFNGAAVEISVMNKYFTPHLNEHWLLIHAGTNKIYVYIYDSERGTRLHDLIDTKWPHDCHAAQMLGRRFPNGPRYPWRECDIIFCHVTCILFSDNLNDLTRDTVSKMLNANRLYCLFTVTLNICYVQPQCTATETCWVRNIRGTSTNFSLAQRPSMYPGSCMWMCSLRSECTATTYYPIGDICELHEYVTEGTSCILLTDNVGFSLWMRKVPGRPCPKLGIRGPFTSLG